MEHRRSNPDLYTGGHTTIPKIMFDEIEDTLRANGYQIREMLPEESTVTLSGLTYLRVDVAFIAGRGQKHRVDFTVYDNGYADWEVTDA